MYGFTDTNNPFLKISQLKNADPHVVAAYRELLKNFLKTASKDINWNGGPLSDIIMGPLSSALASIGVSAEEYFGTSDIVYGLSTGNYDQILLEDKLKNYGIIRKQPEYAEGDLALIFNADISFNIGASVRFVTTYGGLTFLPKKPYFIQSSVTSGAFAITSGIEDPSSIVSLEPIQNNKYRAIIKVRASEPGPDYNLMAGTQLSMVPQHQNLVDCFLVSTTKGGYEGETDSELVQFWNMLGYSPATVATRNGINLLLRRYKGNISDYKIISNGHPALDRGANIFGVALGKQNIYFKFPNPIPLELIKANASLIQKSGPVGTWRATLPARDFPGISFVYKVLPSGADFTDNSLAMIVTPQKEIYGDYGVTIEDGTRAVGTSFCKILVQFTDPNFNVDNVPLGTERYYDIWVIRFSEVFEIQKILSDQSVRNSYDDVLVYAAFPAKVHSVNVTAQNLSGIPVSQSDISAAVAEAINRYPISNILTFSKVAKDSLKYLPSGIELSINSASATLYCRDMTTINASGTSVILFPVDLTRNIHTDTVAFYADDQDINVVIL